MCALWLEFDLCRLWKRTRDRWSPLATLRFSLKMEILAITIMMPCLALNRRRLKCINKVEPKTLSARIFCKDSIVQFWLMDKQDPERLVSVVEVYDNSIGNVMTMT